MPASLLAFGELLLRLQSNAGKRFQQTDGYTASYAGAKANVAVLQAFCIFVNRAEANVAVLLARLGIKTAYLTRIPDNDIANAGITQLKAQGVDTSHVLKGGDK